MAAQDTITSRIPVELARGVIALKDDADPRPRYEYLLLLADMVLIEASGATFVWEDAPQAAPAPEGR
jgi:hypothetical protein